MAVVNLQVTSHAVQRYMERVKPALGFDTAKGELDALVAMAGEPHGKPDWHFLPEYTSEAAEHYFTLSDGIAAAVKGGAVVTVLTRGGACAGHLANKARRKKEGREAKRRRPRRNLRGKQVEPKRIWR